MKRYKQLMKLTQRMINPMRNAAFPVPKRSQAPPATVDILSLY